MDVDFTASKIGVLPLEHGTLRAIWKRLCAVDRGWNFTDVVTFLDYDFTAMPVSIEVSMVAGHQVHARLG